PKGIVKNDFKKKLEVPKSSVFVAYTGEIPYTLEDIVLMEYVESILNIVYTETIREKEGGSYGVDVNGSLQKWPKQKFGLQIYFDTDPAKKDKLTAIVYDEVKKLMSDGPSDVNVNKAKEFMLKKHQEDLTENSYWSGIIYDKTILGIDDHTTIENVISSVTPSMVREFAKKIFSQGNMVEISMGPEK
ncbi:MAG: insulinase family protein, partial [Bacteroidota bacterium]|nr:insulinase family protein [Bacteroidota bacterium]